MRRAYPTCVIRLQSSENGAEGKPLDPFPRMLANARNEVADGGLRSLEPPLLPTASPATFSLFEHRYAGTVDNPGPDGESGEPVARVLEAAVMKRELGLFTHPDSCGVSFPCPFEHTQ